jgi:hypothetical protein
VPPDDPRYDEHRRGLAAALLTEYIERVLAQAPPLSDEQRSKLAELLRPVRVGRRRPTYIPAAIRQGRGRNAS